MKKLNREQIDAGMVDPDENRYLVWVGFIEHEDDKQRKIGYYGKFCKSKKGVLGAFRVMLNNADPYKLMMIDTKRLRNEGANVMETLDADCFFEFEERGIEEKKDDAEEVQTEEEGQEDR